jgi:hypothetical protein
MIAGCGTAAVDDGHHPIVLPEATGTHPGEGFCFDICPSGALDTPTAPDNPWQPGQYGYVVASAPLMSTPPVRVTIGLDPSFMNVLWWRVSKAFNADRTPSSDADSYLSLANTIQYQWAFGSAQPTVYPSGMCTTTCFDSSTMSSAKVAMCIPPYYPEQACAAQNFGCGMITPQCFNQSVNCGGCKFGHCLDHVCTVRIIP